MSSFSEKIVNLSGVPEGLDAQLIAKDLDKNKRSILYVARDDKRLDALRRALWFFAPKIPVFGL